MAPPSIIDPNDFAKSASEAIPEKDIGRCASAVQLVNDEAAASVERQSWELPQKQGLYDPANEHDACGVGFIVAIDGRRSHKVNYRLKYWV